MSEKIARIFVKNIAEIEFRYTTDAHDGTYTVKGEKRSEVLALLEDAKNDGRYVDDLHPMTIYNPKSWAWVAGVLREYYGWKNISYKDSPEREHYSDYDPDDTGFHEDGSQIIY